MNAKEINASNGDGVFAQRVFSSAFPVGSKDPIHKEYTYWANQEGPTLKPGSQKFWYPESPRAEYSFEKSIDANASMLGKAGAVVVGLPAKAVSLFDQRLNALPPAGWTIPLAARPLPEAFEPQAILVDRFSKFFDTGTDAPGANRNKDAQYASDDPYGGAKPDDADAPKGTEQSEAALRYDHHAFLRMRAKRENKYKSGEKVIDEDNPKVASAEYTAWRNKEIKKNLAANMYSSASDHSTIVTNPMHAQKALAYDVAMGHCTIRAKDLHQLRIAGDWRFLDGLDKGNPNKVFLEYFKDGKFNDISVSEWSKNKKGEGGMPDKIVDQRENRTPPPRSESDGEYQH